MCSTKALFAVLMLITSFALAGEEATRPSDQQKKLDDAATVLKEFAGMKEGAPQSLRENAAGVSPGSSLCPA